MKVRALVTVGVLYYIPRTLILQEFYWQTEDIVPELPRVHHFLNHWKREIEGKINSVEVAYTYTGRDYRIGNIWRV
jgi:uncharacterized protein Usg